MTSPSIAESVTSQPKSSLRTKALIALLVLATFGAFSLWVVFTRGYVGFLTLSAREPWALQMLLDLVIACSFVIAWMVRDARKHGIAVWPYIAMTIPFGSIGVLVYLVRRGLATMR